MTSLLSSAVTNLTLTKLVLLIKILFKLYSSQEVFRQIRSKYFFGSKGALAICDASNSESFKNIPSWVESFKKEVGDKPIIFLANKCDLKDQQVTEDDMKQLVKDYSNTEYLYSSAKDGTNAEKAFINLTRLMVAEEDIV